MQQLKFQLQRRIAREISISNVPKIPFQLWVAYAPCGSQHKDAVQVTLEQIDLIKRFINQYPNHLKFVNDSTGKNTIENLIFLPECIKFSMVC